MRGVTATIITHERRPLKYLQATSEALDSLGVPYEIMMGAGKPTQARQRQNCKQALTWFLRETASKYLLFCEDDIIINTTLLPAAVERSKPLAGTVLMCSLRRKMLPRSVKIILTTGQDSMTPRVVPIGNPRDYYGTQCVLFNRDVVQRLVEAWELIPPRVPFDLFLGRFYYQDLNMYEVIGPIRQHLPNVVDHAQAETLVNKARRTQGSPTFKLGVRDAG